MTAGDSVRVTRARGRGPSLPKRVEWPWRFALLLGLSITSLLFVSNMALAQSAEPRVAQLEARLRTAEREKDNAEFRSAMLEARQQVQDAGFTRLEIGMGLFGLLITLLVVMFGFRTEKAAARAAQGELADRKRELDDIIEQARIAAAAAERAAAAAETSFESADQHAKTAADLVTTANAEIIAIRAAANTVAETVRSEAEPTPHDISRALSTPENLRTPAEFQTLIEKHASSGNWEEVIHLARGRQFLFRGEEEEHAVALFQEAWALGRLDREAEEYRVYTQLIDTYSNSESESIQGHVAWGMFNRALSSGILGDRRKASLELQEVIEKFGGSDNALVKNPVAKAHFWRGAYAASEGKVREAISHLRDWKAFQGDFDCDEVTGSVMYKGIINRPEFVKFLEEMGCK